ncbi:MAG: Tex family protein [Bacteroidota bacterium]
MQGKIIDIISKELNISYIQAGKTIGLFKEGATIPFIARYRKELTGGLDEVVIAAIKNMHEKLLEMEKRKESILNAIEEQGKLTDELRQSILNTYVLSELEDIYLPFKQKKKTKAELARQKGLEPLAKIIMAQKDGNLNCSDFVKGEVKSTEEAINGAKDIIAEWVNESISARNTIRRHFEKEAGVKACLIKGKEDEGEKYKDYFEHEEELYRCKSHRMLAMRRGEEEGILRLSIRPPEDTALYSLNRIFVKNDVHGHVADATKDAYKRLLAPSIENEFRAITKEKADGEAIKVFADNLRQLLLGSPLGEKRILAIDPGFKSGCKIVCLDEKGDLLHNETIYPHKPQDKQKLAMQKIVSLVDAYKIDAIAIGNGTAGRETEHLVKRIKFKKEVRVYIVNEAGASVYSASAIAREEFPQYDVTVRGSVSIGRRLMDPLAELVKIDPKSIGVGQYQHDVDQKRLKATLNTVVESCVNKIGVDVNTASKHLLTYVSGLGPQLAQNVVDYRKKNGLFKSRSQLKKVDRMGDKAFEQCAGFLRIKDGRNPLDNSAVHPESYNVVKKMAADINCKVEELVGNKERAAQIKVERYISKSTGKDTISDIIAELQKPGVDPRKKAGIFEFEKTIRKISDLKINMVLPGIITNITNFGAFVDVGVKQDGLVHISNLANEYISNPADHVHLHQYVKVKVVDLDIERKRISLSMKDVDLK